MLVIKSESLPLLSKTNSQLMKLYGPAKGTHEVQLLSDAQTRPYENIPLKWREKRPYEYILLKWYC